MFGIVTKKQYTCGLRGGHNYVLAKVKRIEDIFTDYYLSYTFLCRDCGFSYTTGFHVLTDTEKEIINKAIGPECKKTSKNAKK